MGLGKLLNVRCFMGTSFILFILYLSVLCPKISAQVRHWNLCSTSERNTYNQLAGNVVIDHTNLPEVAGGGMVTLTGQGFDMLPSWDGQSRSGTRVLVMATDFNCVNTIHAHVPVTHVSDTQIRFQLPRNMVMHGGSRFATLNPGEFSVMNMILDYTSPCGDSYDKFPGLPAFGMWCAAGFWGSFPAPRDLSVEAESDAVLQLSWHHDDRHPIDGFRVFMHWCKVGPFGMCETDPYDYDLDDTFQAHWGETRKYWELDS